MDIDKLVRKLFRKYKTKCPFELAALLGIEVWFADLGTSTRGMYRKNLRRRYIVIHTGLSEAWQRIICAHELAHALLHPGLSRFWIDQSTFFSTSKFETQANRFAVHLLTVDDHCTDGESVFDLLRRNEVPKEMHIFY